MSLPKGYVDYLFELDMASRLRELKRGSPNFEKMSPDMQIALMEPHFTSNILPWPKLREAAKNMDKEGVCKELHRDETGRPDLVDRNKWVYEQCMKGYFNK